MLGGFFSIEDKVFTINRYSQLGHLIDKLFLSLGTLNFILQFGQFIILNISLLGSGITSLYFFE